MKKKNLSIIIIIILLLIPLLYFGYNYIIKKSDKKNNKEAFIAENKLEINDPQLLKLNYPKFYQVDGLHIDSGWYYGNISVDSIKREYKMWSSTIGLLPSLKIDTKQLIYKEEDVKNNFYKIFGPDSLYESKSVISKNQLCGYINEYNKELKEYYAETNCGGDWIPIFTKDKIYKAGSTNNEIYTYYYIAYYIEESLSNDYYIYLDAPKKEDYKYENDGKINAKNYLLKTKNIEEGFDQLISSKKLKAYKYTFKKQSDNNYYFYSGELLK